MSLEKIGCYSQIHQWGSVIHDTYGHPLYRLSIDSESVKGYIDLVHMKHWLFGNSFVSMPFSDTGGFRTADENSERKLFSLVLGLASRCRVNSIDLRMDRPVKWLTQDYIDKIRFESSREISRVGLMIKTHKVKMVFELPDSVDSLLNGFKSKLRSQIRRPIKEGMIYRIGKKELLDDFYKVFAENMRDLGSPVHSKKLFLNVLKSYNRYSDLIIIYDKKRKPVAGAMVIGNGDSLSNPWASSLKEYRAFSPNMLLYWVMLEYAVKRGYKTFDFGRSTPGEGTYTFKQQWGAKEIPLYWYNISINKTQDDKPEDHDPVFGLMVKLWQRLPLSVAQILGPIIRKDISL